MTSELTPNEFIAGGGQEGADSDFDTNEDQEDQRTGVAKAMHVGKRAAQTAIIAAEISPANEAIRYGVLAAALAASGSDPVVGAAALGGSTLVVEGTAGLATASIISSERSKQVINKANDKIEKYLKIPRDAQIPPVAEAGVAFAGGTVVAMALKQREDTERTTEQNRKYGLKVSSMLAGALAVQGAAIAYGVENYTDPKAIGVGLIAVGGLYSAAKWAKSKIRQNSAQEPSIEH